MNVQCNFSREDLKALINQDCMLEKRNATFAFYQIFQWVCNCANTAVQIVQSKHTAVQFIMYSKAHSLACGLCALQCLQYNVIVKNQPLFRANFFLLQ